MGKAGRLVYGASDRDLCEILGEQGNDCAELVFEKISLETGSDSRRYAGRKHLCSEGLFFRPSERLKTKRTGMASDDGGEAVTGRPHKISSRHFFPFCCIIINEYA